MKLVYIYHSIAAKGGLERIFCDKMNYFRYHITFILLFTLLPFSLTPIRRTA